MSEEKRNLSDAVDSWEAFVDSIVDCISIGKQVDVSTLQYPSDIAAFYRRNEKLEDHYEDPVFGWFSSEDYNLVIVKSAKSFEDLREPLKQLVPLKDTVKDLWVHFCSKEAQDTFAPILDSISGICFSHFREWALSSEEDIWEGAKPMKPVIVPLNGKVYLSVLSSEEYQLRVKSRPLVGVCWEWVVNLFNSGVVSPTVLRSVRLGSEILTASCVKFPCSYIYFVEDPCRVAEPVLNSGIPSTGGSALGYLLALMDSTGFNVGEGAWDERTKGARKINQDLIEASLDMFRFCEPIIVEVANEKDIENFQAVGLQKLSNLKEPEGN